MAGRQDRDARARTLHGRIGLRQRDRDQSTNPKLLGAFEIDLVHSKSGKQKYRTTAKAYRNEEYCVMFNEVVLQCYALPPHVAALYESGCTIYGPFSKVEAGDLTHQINSTLH
jgi:hypothetical protein